VVWLDPVSETLLNKLTGIECFRHAWSSHFRPSADISINQSINRECFMVACPK